MQYTTSEKGDRLGVKVSGAINFKTANTFKKAIDEFKASGAKSMDVDVSDVDIIDSTGLGLFVLAYDEVKLKGGEITIGGAKGMVLNLLKATHFEDIAILK